MNEVAFQRDQEALPVTNLYNLEDLVRSIISARKAGEETLAVEGRTLEGEVVKDTNVERSLHDLALWIVETQNHRLQTIKPKDLAVIFKLATTGIILENSDDLHGLADSQRSLKQLRTEMARFRRLVAAVANLSLKSGARDSAHLGEFYAVAKNLGLNLTVFQSHKGRVVPPDVVIKERFRPKSRWQRAI